LKPYELLHADCIAAMSLVIEPGSVDAIVTDPPYELGFMGKGWDSTGIANNPAMWRAAFDCLKPGGHLLAFSGTRTYHRMVCAIEDAGFEIRDQIGWAYGSGFPKSLDVSKAIGESYRAPAWQGWGTALKPAWEPICVARKPLTGTVAANVLAHGTGALNIDGCRVGDEVRFNASAGNQRAGVAQNANILQGTDPEAEGRIAVGRWPANLIHDGSDEVLAAFPDSNGSGPARKLKRGEREDGAGWGMAGADGELRDAGTGSAARFFYCAKASKSDRGEGNVHPTVKPTELMRYLCRLITPPGGVVLDPFTGSGSTGKAAVLEGFRFVGCELSDEYVRIAEARIAHAWTSTIKAAA
jgi:site-specific DNA-methyltransferase (adenine-specific)